MDFGSRHTQSLENYQPDQSHLYLAVALILNIKVTISGDEGQLERGGYVIIANHWVTSMVSCSVVFSHRFRIEEGSTQLADRRPVERPVRDGFYRPAA